MTNDSKTCVHCNMVLPNSDRLFEHITYMHSVFYCVDCGLKTNGSKSKETLQHIKECPHTLEPNTQCRYCPRKINGSIELYQNHTKLCRRIRNINFNSELDNIINSFNQDYQMLATETMHHDMVENYNCYLYPQQFVKVPKPENKASKRKTDINMDVIIP